MTTTATDAPLAPPLAASRAALLIVAAVGALAIATALAGGDVAPVLVLWLGDGALVAVWLLAAWGAGDAICRVMRLDDGAATDDHVLRHATAIAGGLGVGSLAILGLGSAGALNVVVAWALLAAGAIAAIVRLRSLRARALAYLGGRAGTAWLGLLGVPALAIAGLAACVVPGFLWGDEPAGYDVVAYHLQLPREWYELGRIATLPHNVFSFFPLNVELHALLAMTLRRGAYAGMYAGQMMCGAFVLLGVVVVYGATRRRGRANATLAAIVMLAFPWVGMLMGIAYDEGGLMCYATLAAAWALRGRWMIAGACAGFAGGCKYTGVTSAILLVPIVVGLANVLRSMSVPLMHGRDAHATNARATLIAGSMFALAALVTFSPWLIRNAIAAGNPVFPLALHTLGHGAFDAGQVERFEVAHSPRPDQRSFGARVGALRDQVLIDWRYGAIGVVPALLLLAIGPAVIARPRDREAWVWLGLIVGNVLVWLFATHLQGRFLTQAIPCCAMLAGAPWQRWRAGVVATVVFAIAVVAYREPVRRLVVPGALNANAPTFAPAMAIGFSDFRGLADDDLRRALDDERATIVLVGDQTPFRMAVPTARLRYRGVFDVPSGVGFRDAWLGKDVPDDAWAIVTPGELDRFGKTYRNLPPIPARWRGVGGTFVVRARDVPND